MLVPLKRGWLWSFVMAMMMLRSPLAFSVVDIVVFGSCCILYRLAPFQSSGQLGSGRSESGIQVDISADLIRSQGALESRGGVALLSPLVNCFPRRSEIRFLAVDDYWWCPSHASRLISSWYCTCKQRDGVRAEMHASRVETVVRSALLR
jgi:hypothetical protein